MSGAKIIEGIAQAIAGDLARITIDGQTWERVRPRTPGSIALTIIPRDDGGIRICSETHPGLILSGFDADKIMRAVLPAITALNGHQRAASTEPK